MRQAHFTLIFIAYALEDGQETAKKLDRNFPQKDIDDPDYSDSVPNYIVYWDYENALASPQWQRKIKPYLRRSKCVIAVATPASNDSGYMQYMLAEARKYQKEILIVQTENTELPAFLRGVGQIIKLENLHEAMQAIRKITDDLDKKSRQYHSGFLFVLIILGFALLALVFYLSAAGPLQQ